MITLGVVKHVYGTAEVQPTSAGPQHPKSAISYKSAISNKAYFLPIL